MHPVVRSTQIAHTLEERLNNESLTMWAYVEKGEPPNLAMLLHIMGKCESFNLVMPFNTVWRGGEM